MSAASQQPDERAGSGGERPGSVGEPAPAGTAGSVVVRPMRREDVPEVLRLIHELAEYERAPAGPQITERALLEDGFSSSPAWFFGLVAERGGALAGHALCNRAYSSWTGRAFYLEDLYVLPTARRAGVGQALLRALCQMALAAGVHRVDWHVLEDNEPALRFYRRAGARDLLVSEQRRAMRLDRARIETVARDDPSHTVHVSSQMI